MAAKVVVVQDVLKTGTGAQTISLPAGSGTVKGYIAFMSLAVTNATAIDGAAWSVGATDGTNQHMSSMASQHDVETSNAWRRMEDDEVMLLMGPSDGVPDIEVDIGATPFDADDEFTINVGLNDDSQPLIKFIVFCGSDISAFVGKGNQTQNINVTQDFTGMGFDPELSFFWGTTAGTGSSSTAGNICFGFAADPGTLVQHCRAISIRDAQGSSTCNGHNHTSRCFISPNGVGGISRSLEFHSFITGGIKLQKRDASINCEFHHISLAFNGAINFKGAAFDGMTATGDKAFTWPGFKPQAVIMIPTYMTTNDGTIVTVSNTGVGDLAVTAFDTQDEWSIGYSDSDGATTMDTQSLADNKAINYSQDAGTSIYVGTLGPSGDGTFDSGGFTINISAYGGSDPARKWAGVAFEEEVVVAPMDASGQLIVMP